MTIDQDMPDSFKLKLKEALKEEDIQEIIRSIASQGVGPEEELRRLREENARLEEGLRSVRQEKAGLKDELEQIRQENSENKEKLRQNEGIVQPFRELLEHYDAYCALPEELLCSLTPSLSADSVLRFWASGCQPDTILHLWDAMERLAEQIPAEQTSEVAAVMSFFIDQYNAVWDMPVYRMMTDETGKPYDDRRHSRSNDCSRYQGNVAEIVLPGIWNLNRGIAERKCVVRY